MLKKKCRILASNVLRWQFNDRVIFTLCVASAVQYYILFFYTIFTRRDFFLHSCYFKTSIKKIYYLSHLKQTCVIAQSAVWFQCRFTFYSFFFFFSFSVFLIRKVLFLLPFALPFSVLSNICCKAGNNLLTKRNI